MRREPELTMSAPALHHHRWTRGQFEKMVEVGLVGADDALELLDGHIVEMSPRESRHSSVVEAVAESLRAAFGEGYRAREEKPLDLGEWSRPEPDVAVVRGRRWDHLEAHPTSAALVVEVAETSLAKDRGVKHAIYARAGIPEYWIVNLPDRAVEVHRDPRDDRYRSCSVLREGDSAQPLEATATPLPIADLLPPR